MKKFLIFFCFLGTCKCLNAQDTKSIDVKYMEAIRYLQNNDTVKKFIKKQYKKSGLRYVISDTPTNANDFSLKHSTTCFNGGDLTLIDSTNGNGAVVQGLYQFSTDTNSIYCIKFSSIFKDRLYAKFARKEYVKQKDGSILAGRGKEVWFTFFFKNNTLQKVDRGLVFYENSVVWLK